jgi:hypothetical protein
MQLTEEIRKKVIRFQQTEINYVIIKAGKSIPMKMFSHAGSLSGSIIWSAFFSGLRLA